MKKTDIHSYEDIVDAPRHTSNRHPVMPQVDRAAQFAPFAALSGHKEAIGETERLVDEKILLDENKKVLLDETLQEILRHIKEHPDIQITYFKADERKTGGTYVTVTKAVRSIDEYHQMLIFMDHTKIKMDDIYEVTYLR